MPGDAVGQDGLPICDEFACRTWGCWCPRNPTVQAGQDITHRCPPEGVGVTPCCGKTPFELPNHDRLTIDDEQVTCMPEVDRG